MNRKVLIVDDQTDFLLVTGRTLGKHFEVRTAESGPEALEATREHGPFAVVLTDHGMPDMDGIEFLSCVERAWPDTTRIMLTAYADLELAVQALHQGAIFRFLQKPVEPLELVDAVEAGVERYRRVEEERLLTEQLQFSRESLLTLTESLERRLADQLGRMRGLQEYSVGLTEARSLEDVAELAAREGSKLLGGRAVLVVLEDVAMGDHAESCAGGAISEQTHSESIRTAEGDIGSVVVDDLDGRLLTENDRQVLRSLASTTAIAAQNQLNRKGRDVAHHATIFALARLAENRDDETGQHLDRVSAYCRMIGEGLREDGHYVDQITDAFLNDLERTAPLHDIGKVGIPDSILLKPGPLDEKEWEVMRRHPTIGAETIRSVLESSGDESQLAVGLEIAWCHHERWDGSGYPRGLAGREIPLSARIMALADCYDALTSARPYKRAWSHEEAVACLLQQRGTHFDPAVVDSFEKRAARADAIRGELADRLEDPRPIEAA